MDLQKIESQVVKRIFKPFICKELYLLYESGHLEDYMLIALAVENEEIDKMALSKIEKIFVSWAMKRYKEFAYKESNKKLRESFVKHTISGGKTIEARANIKKAKKRENWCQ
tara:strand:- start:15 stop:350 length:336 start_codon:yes stop_codon:yes gene_type:complete